MAVWFLPFLFQLDFTEPSTQRGVGGVGSVGGRGGEEEYQVYVIVNHGGCHFDLTSVISPFVAASSP